MPPGRPTGPRLRFLPLAVAGVRTAAKKKLPLLILYGLPAGWMLFFCVQIYLKYAALEGRSALGGSGVQAMTMAIRISGIDIEVRRVVSGYFMFSRLFSVLVIAWFGAGILCEDRRYGAHLLYFSRPLTRLDYVFARFLTTFFFGALAVILPGMLIVGSAAWSSPDWQFLKEESEVVWGTLFFGTVTVTFYTLIVLAVSSLAPSKVFALAAVFPVILIPHGLSTALRRLTRDREWSIMSPLTNLGRVGDEFLNVRGFYDWPLTWSLLALGGACAVSLVVIAWRVRRWEVVG